LHHFTGDKSRMRVRSGRFPTSALRYIARQGHRTAVQSLHARVLKTEHII